MQSEELRSADLKTAFITRFSLSPRTAIGIQTRYLLDQHPEWIHLHWSQNELLAASDRSLLLENGLVARFPRRRLAAALGGSLAACGLAWWADDELTERARKRVLQQARGVSAAYAAPIDRTDARRMRSIVQALDVPFVLHLWDFLDGAVGAPEYQWLVANAYKVLCLSEPIQQALRPLRSDAERLPFYRPAAESRASPPTPGSLTIVLIGNIVAYARGLDLLSDAIAQAERAGIEIQVRYIGSARSLARAESSLTGRIAATGFVESSADRDRLLSEADAAYLPGPLDPPDIDYRSRYSIPSRVLDYMAVGLPIVGPVHADSATGRFLHELGLHETACCTSADEIAAVLCRLARREEWQRRSEAACAAFRRLTEDCNPPRTLRQTLWCAAAGGRNAGTAVAAS